MLCCTQISIPEDQLNVFKSVSSPPPPFLVAALLSPHSIGLAQEMTHVVCCRVVLLRRRALLRRRRERNVTGDSLPGVGAAVAARTHALPAGLPHAQGTALKVGVRVHSVSVHVHSNLSTCVLSLSACTLRSLNSNSVQVHRSL